MSKRVMLVSMEGDKFEVDAVDAEMSGLLKGIIDTAGAGDEIPLANVKSRTLQKILEYLKLHRTKPPSQISKPLRNADFSHEVSEEDFAFVDIDQELLFELIVAANFLNIKPLLDLTCGKVASMIKGRKVEEIRRIFDIENDFTPEQEAQVREENKWCEDF